MTGMCPIGGREGLRGSISYIVRGTDAMYSFRIANRHTRHLQMFAGDKCASSQELQIVTLSLVAKHT